MSSATATQSRLTLRSPMSVYTDAAKTYIQNTKYVTNIQQAYPYADGALTIVGDACTHIAYKNQLTSDQQDSYTGDNQLFIFDQCPACNDCDKQWQLLQAVQDAYVVVAAIKDNSLYTQQDAASRWESLLQKRITAPNAGTCSASADMSERQSFVQPAIRLFSQYKALVHLWNYIVSSSRVLTYMQTYGQGDSCLNITTKYNITGCSATTQSYFADIALDLSSVGYSQLYGREQTMPSGHMIRPYIIVKLYVTQPLSGTQKIVYSSQDKQTIADGTWVTDNTLYQTVPPQSLSKEGKLNIRCFFSSANGVDICKPCTLYVQLTVLPVVCSVSQGTIMPYIANKIQYADKKRQASNPIARLTQQYTNTWTMSVAWYSTTQQGTTTIAEDTYTKVAGLCSIPALTGMSIYTSLSGLSLVTGEEGVGSYIYAAIVDGVLAVSATQQTGYTRVFATALPSRTTILKLDKDTIVSSETLGQDYYIRRI